jgi:hypothetical protein
MSRWTLDFVATEDGKVSLVLEPLDRGKPETLEMGIGAACSLRDNLHQAIHEALERSEYSHDPN